MEGVTNTGRAEAEQPKSGITRFWWWLLDKLATQLVDKLLLGTWLLLSGTAILVWRGPRLSALATLRAPIIPLWIFLAVLLPAMYGILILLRLFKRKDLHVTVDPLQSVCVQVEFDGRPALFFSLRATFTNSSRGSQLLMFAYVQGTTCLMHFHDPLSIGPEEALVGALVQFYCTLPRRLPNEDRYSAKVIFVDAGGYKYPQRVTLRLERTSTPILTKQQPAPQSTPERK